ncbi:MAG: fatty acyl-AMP ligase, partial [Cyanobacteria bacterium J083]
RHIQSACPPQSRVLLLYPPGLEYISAFFGCLYAGVIAIPAYPPRPNRSLLRIQSIIQDAEATVALTNQTTLSLLEKRLTDAPELGTLRWLVTEHLSTDIGANWQTPQVTEDNIAFLQYTSGSTSQPKGVKVSHKNLIHNLGAIEKYFCHSPETKTSVWLPPYHDMGLIGGILQPMYTGYLVVLMSPLMFLQSPVRWLKTISKYKINTSGGPNFAYDLCVKKIRDEQLTGIDLSSWDLAFNGAEPINYRTIEAFSRKFAPLGFRREAFYPCYGMAEATLMATGIQKNSGIITQTVDAKALQKNQVISTPEGTENTITLVSCGQVIPHHQIAIVNPETLTQCAEGEVGEIWLAGASIAQGYWNQPNKTVEIFNAHLANNPADSFLRTGDLGFLAAGELYVTGRLKDVIIINGANHYPQDIERSVEANVTQVRPNCSAGFTVNVAGEEKLIFVAEIERRYLDVIREKNGYASPARKELIQTIKRVIAKQHDLHVHQVILLKPGSIPKTSSGKIQRHTCRQDFLAGELKEV